MLKLAICVIFLHFLFSYFCEQLYVFVAESDPLSSKSEDEAVQPKEN